MKPRLESWLSGQEHLPFFQRTWFTSLHPCGHFTTIYNSCSRKSDAVFCPLRDQTYTRCRQTCRQNIHTHNKAHKSESLAPNCIVRFLSQKTCRRHTWIQGQPGLCLKLVSKQNELKDGSVVKCVCCILLLQEALSSVLSTHTGWHTTACNSSSEDH